MSHRLSRTIALALALAAAYGCTGGLSCGSGSGCSNDYAYPLTADRVPNGTEFVDEGVRMRMTQSALDFLSDNLRALLVATFAADPQNPNVIVISNTDRVDIGGGISIGQGEAETHPTEIYLDATEFSNSITMEFVGDDPGEQDAIHLRAENVPIGIDARIFSDFGTGNAACDLFGTNSGLGGRPFFTTLTIDLLVKPRVGNGAECDSGSGECLKIDVEVQDAVIGGFGAGDLELDKPPICGPPGDCDIFGCTDATPDGLGPCSEDCSDGRFLGVAENGDTECNIVCVIGDVFVDIAAGLAGLVVDLIEGFLPTLLEAAIANALADFDGSPIAASGRLDLAGFAPGVLPDSALDLGFAIGPTVGAFDVNDPANTAGAQGMDMIFKSGFEAAPSLEDPSFPIPHPCVKPIAGADFSALYGGFRFEAPDAEPLTGVYNGQVYHLGASLAEDAVNQMLFGMYNSGSLCLEVSTDGVHQLTGGAFPLSAGLVDVLTGGKLRQYARPDAPAIIAIAPSQPPVITYGAGTDTDGHMNIDWPKTEISFYVLMNERFSRVFAVETDISLALSIFNDPATSTLNIAVVDGPNVDNFVETYNELMPGVAFTEVLEGLIGTVFDAALGDGLSFDFDVGSILADALGAPIFVNFLGLETIPAPNYEFLNVYLALTDVDPSPVFAHTPPVRLAPPLEVAGLPSVDDDALRPGATPFSVPEDFVRIEGIDDGLEVLARVDFGAWRGPFRPDADGVVTVRDPKLRLVGHHRIVLRARDPLVVDSLDPKGTEIAVWVDPEAPRATLDVVGTDLVARGTDSVAREKDLAWQWQIDDEGYGPPSSASTRPLEDFDGARRVSVRAVDPAGNISRPARVDLVTARLRAADEAEMAGGCAQTGDLAWLGALAVATGLGLRRRRPRI